MPTEQQISQALTHIADKLGYTVQKIHEIYTQGHQLEGTLSLAFMALWIALVLGTTLTSFLLFRRTEGNVWRKEKDYRGREKEKVWDRDNTLGATVMATAGVASISVFLLLTAYEPTLKMLAPEYTAAKAMIEQATIAIN